MKFLFLTLSFLFMTLPLLSDFEKAQKLYKAEKYTEAKNLFESYLKTNPNHTETLEYLGDIAGIEKKWDVAISYYKQIKEQYPKNATYWYKYGGAMGMKAKTVNKFKALGMIDTIETAFLTAAKLDEKHIDTRWALVMLYIELPGIVGGSEAKAQKYAAELMKLSKVDGYLAKGYIDVYFERYANAEINYLYAHKIANSITTYTKLYDLYKNKLSDKNKADQLKKEFEK